MINERGGRRAVPEGFGGRSCSPTR